MLKNRTSITASLFFMLLFFGCVKNSVYAQESYWYGGVSIGEASIAEDIYDDSTPTSFYLGKRYSESIAFEFGYLDLGGFESDPEESFDASVDISGIELSALGLAKVGESVEFFGKAGFYIWEGDEDIDGTKVEDSDISLLLGLGLNFPIGATFGARAEYVNYFDIGDEDSDAINIGLYVNF
jgi:hypothetical protein